MKKTPSSPPVTNSPSLAESVPSATPSGSAATPSQDVVLIHGVTEDRKGLRVLRAREQTLELGEVRPLVEGQPINNDVVRLHPRKGAPHICDVETTFAHPKPAALQESGRLKPTRNGPAQVASRAYRDNWDTIWSKRVTAKGSSSLN